jgi:hypothetical protein
VIGHAAAAAHRRREIGDQRDTAPVAARPSAMQCVDTAFAKLRQAAMEIQPIPRGMPSRRKVEMKLPRRRESS